MAGPWDGKKPSEEELKKILDDHRIWLYSKGNTGGRADLRGSDLTGVDLSESKLAQATFKDASLIDANFAGASLAGTDFEGSILSMINLTRASLFRANLTRANLSGANLSESNLSWADLTQANLSHAYPVKADLSLTNLTGADLTQADFTGTYFTRSYLTGADMSGAFLANTAFIDIDLSKSIGLDDVRHIYPSTIGIDTIYRSRGKIPESFLRGCGVPQNLIDLIPSLATQPIQFYSCFISHSSADKEFADRLYADLQAANVRTWYAPEDLKIGDKILHSIDRAIRLHDKLLLVLSEKSIESEWVETEMDAAFEKERQKKELVLFPIRIDDAVMESDHPWARKLRSRNIGDFTGWKDHDRFRQAFDRLIRDLKADQAIET